MEWVESTGGSIDEAKDVALDRLGVHEDDAEFEVLSDVTTGLFGRVKEEARVRARVRPAAPRAKDDRRRQRGKNRGRGRSGRDSDSSGGQRQGKQRGKGGGQRGNGEGGKGQGSGSQKGENPKQGKQKNGSREGSSDKGRASGSQERKNEDTGAGSGKNGGRGKGRSRDGRGDSGGRDEKRSRDRSDRENRNTTVNDDQPTMPLVEQAALAEEFVTGLAERFGTPVEFSREDVEDDEIRITVTGDDLGRMVGRRGVTAGAIDDLVRTVLQRQAGSARNGRIRVDIGGVRARRAEALAVFARSQAADVRDSGVSRALEPMGAADRKVVHDALTDEHGVGTISEGEDPRRRVVIVPAGADD